MVRQWQHIPERKACERLLHDYRAVTCKVSRGLPLLELVAVCESRSHFSRISGEVHISWLWLCVLLPLNCLHYPYDWTAFFEKGWWCLGEVWDSLWFYSWKTDPLDGSVYLKLLSFFLGERPEMVDHLYGMNELQHGLFLSQGIRSGIF